MLKRILAILLILSLLAAAVWYVTSRSRQPEASATITFAADTDTSGFARATDVIDFSFPHDHGPHFDYQTEWWYYTGNLETANGDHFGYQLTFFRRGLTPGAPPSGSDLATNQIYFAHFAITDVKGNTHTFAERFSRGAGGLSGATSEPFRVWLEDWSAGGLNKDSSVVRLQAREGEMALDLTLRAVKPIVAHGDNGLSPKSEERGNASYYLSYTRMATTGQMTARGAEQSVTGESWFDHEWSTSALGPHGVGWDWFSLQLSDGRELMIFQIRRDDGGIESVSGGTLVEKDGTTRRLSADEVRITVTDTWRSSETDTEYPAGLQISVPSAGIELTVEPWIDAQEMRVAFTYWEGAVRISGMSGGVAVSGNGYVEMTGYKGSMQGVF